MQMPISGNTVIVDRTLQKQEIIAFSFSERSLSYSDESRLSNLLRRITREDDRDRRLATVKQLKEFIQQPENKLVSRFYFSSTGAFYKTVFLKFEYWGMFMGNILYTIQESVFLDCSILWHSVNFLLFDYLRQTALLSM